jgi:hypothetical protein
MALISMIDNNEFLIFNTDPQMVTDCKTSLLQPQPAQRYPRKIPPAIAVTRKTAVLPVHPHLPFTLLLHVDNFY